MNTDALNGLHSAGQQWIEDQGWTGLTPVQQEAFPLILSSDRNVIISAPTGSGKTEPVLLSALTKAMVQPEGRHVRIWYFVPTRALNRNMYERHMDICDEDYFNLPVTLFQGDASVSCKLRLYDNPDGIVDITPESQEANFQLRPDILRKLIGYAGNGGVEVVIVDEIHEFLGTPRGMHLAFLLHRMSLIWGKPFLFYGLSATIGGAEAAVKTLKDMTGSPRDTVVLKVSCKTSYDIKVDCFPEEDKDGKAGGEAPDGEAMLFDALLRETQGKNALLFTNSRGMAEQGAYELRRRMEDESELDHTRAHTSSRTRKDREAIELALRDGEWDGYHVFATQTLQSGVDFPGVDLVCQIGAPTSVFSLAQRTGRSGRCGGTPTLYLCTRGAWDLVRGIAACNLMKEGVYECPDLKTERWDVVAYQILSVVQEHGAIGVDRLTEIVTGVAGYPYIDAPSVREIVDYLLDGDFLSLDSDKLVIGGKGDHYVCKMDSFTAFLTPVRYTIVADGRGIGHIETASCPREGDHFLFAERAWTIRSRENRKIHVVPAEGGKRLKYYGEGPSYGMEMEQEMKRILLSGESYDFLGESCAEPLRELRSIFAKKKTLGTLETPCMVDGADLFRLYPFCGTKVFRTLRRLLGAVADGYILKMALSPDAFLSRCRSIVSAPPDLAAQLEQEIITSGIEPGTKLEALLFPKYRSRLMATRDYDMEGALTFLRSFIGERPGDGSDGNARTPQRILVYALYQSEGEFGEERKRLCHERVREALRWVKSKAAGYGKDLSFILETAGLDGESVRCPTPKDADAGMEDGIDADLLLSHAAAYPDTASLSVHAAGDLGCDHVIVLAVVDATGRSFAQRMTGSPLMGCSLLFWSQQADFPSGMVAHEVLHLFGAVDLYVPFQSAENEVFIRNNYSTEVMDQSNHPVSELSMSPITAWTSGLTDAKEEWFSRFNLN